MCGVTSIGYRVWWGVSVEPGKEVCGVTSIGVSFSEAQRGKEVCGVGYGGGLVSVRLREARRCVGYRVQWGVSFSEAQRVWSQARRCVGSGYSRPSLIRMSISTDFNSKFGVR